jgi:bifunctional non-homologous end joining protein LigD
LPARAEPAAGDRVVTALEVDGRVVRITNPDRVLWPRTGTTKRDLLAYDLAIAPVLLAHLANRGLTLGRWPGGVEAKGWLQAECRGRPPWMRFEASHSRRTGGAFDYCVVDDRAGLAWLVGLGTIELHPFPSTVDRRAEPSFVVFDLDPMPPATVLDAARVALALQHRLDELGLGSYPKTSGLHGLHVFVPIAAGQTFDATKAFARSIAAELAAADPGVTDRMTRRASRSGLVLVDWLQNDPSRSIVAAYSPRAAAVPFVSTPVRWAEIADAAARHDRRALLFDMAAALDRVDRLGDLFAPTLAGGPMLPRLTAASGA